MDNRINIKCVIILLVIVTNRLKKFIACDLKDEFLPCEALALFLQVNAIVDLDIVCGCGQDFWKTAKGVARLKSDT